MLHNAPCLAMDVVHGLHGVPALVVNGCRGTSSTTEGGGATGATGAIGASVSDNKQAFCLGTTGATNGAAEEEATDGATD